MTVVLTDMPPAQEQAWLLLLRLADTNHPWVLIGGQLVHLLAIEDGAVLPRATLDALARRASRPVDVPQGGDVPVPVGA